MTPREKKPATHLVGAVPGALTAVLLIGAVAFGSTSLREASADAGAAAPDRSASLAGQRRETLVHDPAPVATVPTKAPEAAKQPVEKLVKPEPVATSKSVEPAEKPADKPVPTEKPKPAPVETKKPAPAPTHKPAPADPTAFGLEAWAKDTKIKLAWGAFGGDGFEYYKVVRSGDGTVTWPASGDDVVVGVVGDRHATWFADKPPCGTAWTYRVFAVRHGDGGYVTLAASNPAAATAACAPAPTPVEVKAIAFEVSVLPGEGIRLAWEGCWRDGFKAYKVVRSATNADPRFPLNNGTELIGVIGDVNQTLFVDTSAGVGQAWTYRVVAVTDGGGTYVPLCETAAKTATGQ